MKKIYLITAFLIMLSLPSSAAFIFGSDDMSTVVSSGINGINGTNGTNGTSINFTSITANGTDPYAFDWLFNTGFFYTTPNLRGATGATGSQGIQGINGINGTNASIINSTCSSGTEVLQQYNGSWSCVAVPALNHTHAIEYFYPTNITMNNGASITGNHTLLTAHNDLGVKIMETTGTSALTVTINFTSPATFDTLIVYGGYIGSSAHYVEVDFFNRTDGIWHSVGSFPSTPYNTSYSFNIPDPENHVDGNTSVRFRHVGSGNINHYLFLDYVVLAHGGSSGSSNLGVITAHIANTTAHTDSDSIFQFINDANYITNTTMDKNYSNLTNAPHGQLSLYINNQGTVITTGLKPLNPTIHYNGSFSQISAISDVSGNITVDVLKGNFTTIPSKIGTINITNTQKYQNSTFSGWIDTVFKNDDNFQFNVTSVSSITWINIDIETVKS